VCTDYYSCRSRPKAVFHISSLLFLRPVKIASKFRVLSPEVAAKKFSTLQSDALCTSPSLNGEFVISRKLHSFAIVLLCRPTFRQTRIKILFKFKLLMRICLGSQIIAELDYTANAYKNKFIINVWAVVTNLISMEIYLLRHNIHNS